MSKILSWKYKKQSSFPWVVWGQWDLRWKMRLTTSDFLGGVKGGAAKSILGQTPLYQLDSQSLQKSPGPPEYPESSDSPRQSFQSSSYLSLHMYVMILIYLSKSFTTFTKVKCHLHSFPHVLQECLMIKVMFDLFYQFLVKFSSQLLRWETKSLLIFQSIDFCFVERAHPCIFC